jgi:hypothetical protein
MPFRCAAADGARERMEIAQLKYYDTDIIIENAGKNWSAYPVMQMGTTRRKPCFSEVS